MSDAGADIELFVCNRAGENFIGFSRATEREIIAAADAIAKRRGHTASVQPPFKVVPLAVAADPRELIGTSAKPMKSGPWSLGDIKALRDAFASGRTKAVRQRFPERAPKSIGNAIQYYVNEKNRDGSPRFPATPSAIALEITLPAPVAAPTIDLEKLEADLRREAPAIIAKRDGTPLHVKPPTPTAPIVRPRYEAPQQIAKPRTAGRPPLDEDFKLRITSALRPERPAESKQKCRLCGAGAFTLPISQAIGAERECRDRGDCERRQSRGGVAAIGAKGGQIRPAASVYVQS